MEWTGDEEAQQRAFDRVPAVEAPQVGLAIALADVPGVVAAQTKDYREEQDLVGQWLSERVESGSATAGCKCPSKLLYGDYYEWAEANGLRPCSSIALGRRLRERGFVSERKASGPEFQGIALKPKH